MSAQEKEKVEAVGDKVEAVGAKTEATKVEEGTQTTTKKRRRGITNETRTTSRKKFSHKDSVPNIGLFVGNINVRVAWVTFKPDTKQKVSFAGKAVPQLVIDFVSPHTNPAEVRVATKTIWAFESKADYIPNGKFYYLLESELSYIKHLLDVIYLKGRELTEEEVDKLELGYVDFDEDGNYDPVDVDDVLKAWGVLFDNVVNMIETANNGKSALLDANGKPKLFWGKLIRYYKKNGEWTPSGSGSEEGDLVFPTFVGTGVWEEYTALPNNSFKAPNLMLDVTKEAIVPMANVKSKKQQQPNMTNNPAIAGMPMGAGVIPQGGMMGGMPMGGFDAFGGNDMPTDLSDAFAADGGNPNDLPF